VAEEREDRREAGVRCAALLPALLRCLLPVVRKLRLRSASLVEPGAGNARLLRRLLQAEAGFEQPQKDAGVIFILHGSAASYSGVKLVEAVSPVA